MALTLTGAIPSEEVDLAWAGEVRVSDLCNEDVRATVGMSRCFREFTLRARSADRCTELRIKCPVRANVVPMGDTIIAVLISDLGSTKNSTSTSYRLVVHKAGSWVNVRSIKSIKKMGGSPIDRGWLRERNCAIFMTFS